MAIVKGQNLRVFIRGRAIAAALDCQLSVQLNTRQYSTKDDEGAFTQLMAVSLNWSLTANAAVTDNAELDAIGVSDIDELIGQNMQVQLSTASGGQNRTQGEILLAGEAILSDVQYTAQNRQRTTCQLTFTGKKNMLIDLRELITADLHNIRTADGNIVFAAHEQET